MATNTQGQVTRLNPRELLNYLQFTINFNDNGVASGAGVPIWLPAGALVMFVGMFIATAFNAGTTNVITVGTNASSYNNLVASGDVLPGTLNDSAMVLRGMDLGKLSADTQVFYTYAQTGGAASAGKAYCTVVFANDNDINKGT